MNALPRSQAGYTLLELTLVAAILVPILGVIVTGTRVTTSTLSTDDAAASAMERLQRIAQRLTYYIRPCVLSTYQVEATAADVGDRATAAGEWIDPVDLEGREAIRFQAADTTLSMNASRLTGARVVRFQMESRELRNGRDDDGDGLVDEGQVMLDIDGKSAALAQNIEACSFSLDGRLLRIDLRAAVRREGNQIVRASLSHVLCLRNN